MALMLIEFDPELGVGECVIAIKHVPGTGTVTIDLMQAQVLRAELDLAIEAAQIHKRGRAPL